MENNDSLSNNYSEKYHIDNYLAFGRLCYYGIFSYLNTIEYNQLLSDYNIITFILKNFCLEVCLEKLCIGNTFYAIQIFFL